jgi:signal transduction histidine kinase
VLPVSRATADVAAIVTNAVEELRLAHPQRAIDASHRGDCGASVDSDRIAQLIVNLAENALRHAEEGTAIAVRVNGDDAKRVVIEVENRGLPIRPEDRMVIFDLYRRGRSKQKDEGTSLGAGLGLGLYIVREIARAHDGEATVESSSESGTVFRILLPR